MGDARLFVWALGTVFGAGALYAAQRLFHALFGWP
jgi:hypothetical protein